jgi:hypothetical protein
MEVEMGNGESVNVVVFGEHALRGRVEVVNDRNTTIHFGAFGGWSVTVPRSWISRREDGWFVEIA